MWLRAFGEFELLALMSFTAWVIIGTAAALRWVDRSGRFGTGFLIMGALVGAGLLLFVSFVQLPDSAFARGAAVLMPFAIGFYVVFAWLEIEYGGIPLAAHAIAVAYWSVGYMCALVAGLALGFSVNLLLWIPVILLFAAFGGLMRRGFG